MRYAEILPLFKQTWSEFQRHNAHWLAAALAYFAAFAVAPLIIVVVEIVGLVLGNHHQARDVIFGYLRQNAGAGAGAVRQIVASNVSHPRSGLVAQIIGWIVFVIGAIGLFGAVQFALNTVWDVAPKKMSIIQAILQRASSFAILMSIALLLLVSIGVNALLTLAAAHLTHLFFGFATLMKVADFIVSFAVIWIAFAVLFEYLPDCRIEWRDVWLGSALTALLFVIGQFLLGWYLGRAAMTSSYGALGSLVVFLVWVNYSAQIMLFGAEFTHVYARRKERAV